MTFVRYLCDIYNICMTYITHLLNKCYTNAYYLSPIINNFGNTNCVNSTNYDSLSYDHE